MTVAETSRKLKDMTVAQTSRRLEVNVETVYKLLYSGRLQAIKKDGVWQIDAESVEARLRARKDRQ